MYKVFEEKFENTERVFFSASLFCFAIHNHATGLGISNDCPFVVNLFQVSNKFASLIVIQKDVNKYISKEPML